ncbi:MAG: NUDIX hydrolase [Planctomycetota bacterium]
MDRPPDPPPFPSLPTVSSERIYDSWWVGLRRDVLRLEDGSDQEHHFVEIGPAVVVVPIRTDGRIVLVGQYRAAHGETHWELPAGRLEPDEDPRDGALRELAEETGHAAGVLSELPGFYPINGISDHWAHAYCATDCEETGAQSLDPSERMTVRAFDPRDVAALLEQGRMKDGFSALPLLYARFLGLW